jgi:glycosidase
MINSIYYNPLDKACKSVIGAVKENEKVTFHIFSLRSVDNERGAIRFKTPNEEECITPTLDAYLLLNRDGENPESFLMQKTAYGWTISIKIAESGLYFYTFSIGENIFVSCGEQELGYLSSQPNSFILTVCKRSYRTPKWFKGGVMYQIFPDRFYRQGTMPDIKGRIQREDWGGTPYYRPNAYGKVLNNDFFGGNLKGIQSKLPYLKSLGITIIYLNPIFEAASNHRYDTSDYMNIDPFLGTEEEFKRLIDEAESLGIRIILDGVFNHTGDNSVYFNKYGNYPSLGAYQSKDSPYYTWYCFQEFPNRYDSWWGIDILPQVNESSPDYQKFIFEDGGVLKKWLQFGIGGYRLDVADELPDFFLKKLRKSVKESNKNAIIIGEVWEDASTKIAYSERREYLHGKELDSVMNYPWKDAIISYMHTGNAYNLLASIRAIINHYPKQTIDCLMNILGTHDTSRILTVLGGIHCNNKDEMASEKAYLTPENKQIAIEKLKMAAVLQFMLPGVPCIYYGDENGMEGHIDPFCRRCFDWENLNKDLIAFYKKLGEIRNQYSYIFQYGNFEFSELDGGFLIFTRERAKSVITVCVNNSSKRYKIQLPKKSRELLTDNICEGEFEINPYSFAIFK